MALSAERVDLDAEMRDALGHDAERLIRLLVQHSGVPSYFFEPLAHFGTQIPNLAAQTRHVAVHGGFQLVDSLGESLDG